MLINTMLVITEINDGSLVGAHGAKVGDVICAVDGTTVTTNLSLSSALQSGAKVLQVFGTDGLISVPLNGQKLGIVTESRERDSIKLFASEEVSEQFDRMQKGYVDSVLLTTTHSMPNYEIAEVKGVVTAEAALGINVLRDILVSFRDSVGGRSKTSENALRALREHALEELKVEAHAIGANAVVGVDLDYSEMSSHNMLFLVASGTAVVVEQQGGREDKD